MEPQPFEDLLLKMFIFHGYVSFQGCFLLMSLSLLILFQEKPYVFHVTSLWQPEIRCQAGSRIPANSHHPIPWFTKVFVPHHPLGGWNGISAINSTKIELDGSGCVFFSFEKNPPFFWWVFSKSRGFSGCPSTRLTPPPENAKNFIRGSTLVFEISRPKLEVESPASRQTSANGEGRWNRDLPDWKLMMKDISWESVKANFLLDDVANPYQKKYGETRSSQPITKWWKPRTSTGFSSLLQN